MSQIIGDFSSADNQRIFYSMSIYTDFWEKFTGVLRRRHDGDVVVISKYEVSIRYGDFLFAFDAAD